MVHIHINNNNNRLNRSIENKFLVALLIATTVSWIYVTSRSGKNIMYVWTIDTVGPLVTICAGPSLGRKTIWPDKPFLWAKTAIWTTQHEATGSTKPTGRSAIVVTSLRVVLWLFTFKKQPDKAGTGKTDASYKRNYCRLFWLPRSERIKWGPEKMRSVIRSFTVY